ncbi:MarR family winged helix-turn-helix transcriptional regulator [Streptomyces sp. IBSBF 2806]|uniref:MarR family winged helix-turn-helix transcriptional regulator n=1 Tax=Streptomyces sp. IBSBF 2806 TaxID=2903529 RepID=UPI002FDBB754
MTQRGAEAGRAAFGGAPSSRPELDREAEEVTVAVMAASRLLMAVSARALASIDGSLTLPQLRALAVLDACGPVKLVTLAATLGVNPSTALRMAERLESLGLLDRRANPGNRREVILSLTPAGQALVCRVMEHRRAEIGSLVARLPATTRAALVPALRDLVSAADEIAVDPFDEARRIGGLVDDPLSRPERPSDAPARAKRHTPHEPHEST